MTNQFNDRRDIAQIDETLRSLTDEQYMHTHMDQNGFWLGIAPTWLSVHAGRTFPIRPGARGFSADGVLYFKLPRMRAAALAMASHLDFLPAVKEARRGDYTPIEDLADRYYDFGAPPVN